MTDPAEEARGQGARGQRIRVTLEGSTKRFPGVMLPEPPPTVGATMPHDWWMGHDMIVTAVESADRPDARSELSALRERMGAYERVAETAREVHREPHQHGPQCVICRALAALSALSEARKEVQ